MAGAYGIKTFMVLVGSLLMLATPVLAAQRVALVIGNAAYAHVPRLSNPPNDAEAISASLGRLGFTVTRLADAGMAELIKGLRAFKSAARGSEIALVFYSGHGIEVDKRNFLVPVDARLASADDVEYEAVSLDLVMRAVGRNSGLGLVILDACRDNPFAAAMQRHGSTKSTRAIGKGLARVEPTGETLVAYAAKEGTQASDGEGSNSPYTTALLSYLEEPGLEVGMMFRKVRDAVLKATGNDQEPFVYGSLSSEGVYLAAASDPAQTRWETVEVRHGTKTYSDGRYVGQLRGDKRHGRGTYTWSSGRFSGNRYEGEWRDDKQHGRGTFTWPNGGRYEGEFRDGKRTGQGTFTWPSHGRYEGEWRDDKPHGRGTFTEPDGTRDVGQWRNGCFGERGGDWRTVYTSAEACGLE